MKNKNGKTVAKGNLPSKICVTCNRPFTWRKKWERNWDEVTTCSKSCNSKRKAVAKQQEQDGGAAASDNDSVGTQKSSSSSLSPSPVLDKKALRKQHKEAVKAQKQERKLKRMGNAPKEVGRKPCDICAKPVDLLVRCTIDETQQYRMVCGRCWPSVSGGVPDGVSTTHPHYRYGGLWKNRNANLKKRIGSGGGNNNNNNNNKTGKTNDGKSKLLEEIRQSILAEETSEGISQGEMNEGIDL